MYAFEGSVLFLQNIWGSYYVQKYICSIPLKSFYSLIDGLVSESEFKLWFHPESEIRFCALSTSIWDSRTHKNVLLFFIIQLL